MLKKAIIPAAGYGTRSLPITKVIPKEMFPIAGKPVIHYVVEEAMKAGIEEILIIVSREKNTILDYFDRSLELEAFLEKKGKTELLEKINLPKVHIQYVRQPFAHGLGDAVRLGESFVGNEPFAVLLPDDLLLKKGKPDLQELIDTYNTFGRNTFALMKANRKDLSDYGVIDGRKLENGRYEVLNLVEKPQFDPPSDLVVVGRYVFHPGIFRYLKQIEPGAGGELQLTDAMKEMLKEGPGYGVELTGKRFDVGKEEDYVKAIIEFTGYKKI